VARLFVAVRPPAPVLARIAELPRPAEAGVSWVPAEQWHVTLRFIGEADVDEVIGALADAAPALRRLPAVQAVLGPSVARLGRQVICLPVAGLDALAAVVGEATAAHGRPVDPRPFRGHLTLARLRHRGACRLAGHPLRATFAATEIELVSSMLGRTGAHHEVVRAFSLTC
jgi:2'-5' RNA ligase